MKEFLEQKKMPIGSYCSPQPPSTTLRIDNQITLEQYKLLAECGINIVYAHNEVFGTATEKYAWDALDLCEKVGVKYFVRDDISRAYVSLGGDEHGCRSYKTLTQAEKDALDAKFEASLKRYCTHPAFGGISFWDEPGYDSFDAIAAAKKVFDRVCPDKCFYVNHFPYYITPEQYQFGYWCKNKRGEGSIEAFRVTENRRNIDRYKYLHDGFIEKLHPEVFSYDAYPFQSIGSATTAVHEILWELPQYLHAAEQKDGTPFWVYLQAGGKWENSKTVRVPTEAETRLGVSVPLLYGAKGLQVFPYMLPNEWFRDPNVDAGLVDRFGNKTERYEWYKSVFRHVRAMEKYLMTAALRGIVSVGEYKNGLPCEEELNKILWNDCIFRGKLSDCEKVELALPCGLVKSAKASSQCLLGFMESEGTEFLFIVNNSSTESANLSLWFDREHDFEEIRSGETTNLQTDCFRAALEAGECVLLAKKQ